MGRPDPQIEPRPRAGFTFSDAVALVAGAAVASLHLRGAVPEHANGGAWALAAAMFAGIGLTATGPFLALSRWWRRSGRGVSRAEGLWAIQGAPWVMTAVLASWSGSSRAVVGSRAAFVSGVVVFASVCAASLLVAVLARRGMLDKDGADTWSPTTWTDWVGVALASTWPLQCAFGFILSGLPA